MKLTNIYRSICLIILLACSGVALAVPRLPSEPPLPQMPSHNPAEVQYHQAAQTADPQAWVLNSAQRYNLQQAKQWVTRLQKAGFAAYCVEVGRNQVMVVVGPSLSQKQLLQQQTQLSQQYRFNTTIANYQPFEGEMP